ncbi:hypothetical protein [Campylobacter upsaliensis]|uniref:hypothetical protein n=1 Tax=Campylobacter upsaliensis TaxID=28080 RepID=UPI0022EA9EC2|nr:hypothetical protein [Campylobacter upsaliensis]MEB2805219.1 hypothetical protein [Campylobacter upsaliensis]
MRIHKALFEVAGSIHEAQKEVLKGLLAKGLKALSCSRWSRGKADKKLCLERKKPLGAGADHPAKREGAGWINGIIP